MRQSGSLSDIVNLNAVGNRSPNSTDSLELQEVEMVEIQTLIRDFILREFLPGEDPDELKDDTRLITGGILDSIRTLKLVTFLEDYFNIRVEHLDSIDQIASLVSNKKNAA
jgi:acyl carrier protein